MESAAVGPSRTEPLTLALPSLTMPVIEARSPLVLDLVGSYCPFELSAARVELKLSTLMLLPLRSMPALAPHATENNGALVVPTRITRLRVAENAGTVT